ncbi:MAG: STAS domain-containing protein [Nocardioidaceae bacterium]
MPPDAFDHPAEFGIVVRPDVIRPVLVVTGEIDFTTAPDLYDAVRRQIAQGHEHLVVDLAGVSFMDGSVLRFLVTARRQLSEVGGSLRVTGASGLLRRLMDATGLSLAFPELLVSEA